MIAISHSNPYVVFDGSRYHLFTGSTIRGGIKHSVGPSPAGPWMERKTLHLKVDDKVVFDPHVRHECSAFVMVARTTVYDNDGTFELFVSVDGDHWYHASTILVADSDHGEHYISAPRFDEHNGVRRLIYKTQDATHVAHSLSGGWEGPWHRRGILVD